MTSEYTACQRLLGTAALLADNDILAHVEGEGIWKIEPLEAMTFESFGEAKPTYILSTRHRAGMICPPSLTDI